MNMVHLSEAARQLGVSKQFLDYHKKKGHITVQQSGPIFLVDVEVLKRELLAHTYGNTETLFEQYHEQQKQARGEA